MLTSDIHFSHEQVKCLKESLESGADLVTANLEMPFTETREPYMPGALLEFAGDPKKAVLLNELGISFVSTATNHCMDWGGEGIETTSKLLDNLCILHCGVGENKTTASETIVIKKSGYNIGLASFCKLGHFSAKRNRPGAANYSKLEIIKRIRSLRTNVDIIIINLHVGLEYCQYPTPQIVKECRKFVDCGADLIICHHPHVLQAIEKYKHGIIAYSLGNFIFRNKSGHVISDALWKERHQSIILETCFYRDRSKPEFSFLPVEINDSGIPEHASEQAASEIAAIFEELKGKLDTISSAEIYHHFVGNVLDREIGTYKKLWKEKGWKFLWPAIKGLRPRHVKMLLSYFFKKFFRKNR